MHLSGGLCANVFFFPNLFMFVNIIHPLQGVIHSEQLPQELDFITTPHLTVQKTEAHPLFFLQTYISFLYKHYILHIGGTGWLFYGAADVGMCPFVHLAWTQPLHKLKKCIGTLAHTTPATTDTPTPLTALSDRCSGIPFSPPLSKQTHLIPDILMPT